MATLEDVIAGLIAFRETTYSKLDALQTDLNALKDPSKKIQIWRDCDKCHGDGKVLSYAVTNGIDPLDIREMPPGNPPEEMTCPNCKGAKRFVWGWQETNPMEAP